MSEFTAEDYANADFARNTEGRRAVRTSRGRWHVESPFSGNMVDVTSDSGMALLPDWSPVAVESCESGRVTERTLEVARSNAAKKRQRLLDHIAYLDEVIRRRNRQIEKLTAEASRPEPLSLDALNAAWENAEVARECNKGDVMIYRRGLDRYGVYPAQSGRPVDWGTRILSRGPKREPWQDIADVLMEDRLAFEEDAGGIAKRLYERGVRVV